MAGKFALLIGNSQYRDRDLGGLRAPDVDVRAFEEVLRSPDICEFNDVRCLVNEGFANVHREIARFYGGRGRDDLLLLYFSGHGVKDDAGHLYLAVQDTERAVLSGTAVPSSFIANQMDACNSRSLVLMLDCCNSGAFSAGTKGASQMVDTRAAFQGNGIGRVVLTATDSTQYAWEGNRVIGEDADKSLFTHFIVEGLRTGAADIDDDGYINIDELYDYVFEQIRQRTHKQTPSKCVYQAQGELRLAKNCSPSAAALPDLLLDDISSRHAEVRCAAVPEIEKHLTHARRGAAAVEALERLMREDDSRKVVQAATAALDRHAAGTLCDKGELVQARDRIEHALLVEPGHRGARTLKTEIERAIVTRDAEAAKAAALEAQHRATNVAVDGHLAAARAAIASGAFGDALKAIGAAAALNSGAAELDALTRAAHDGAAAAEKAKRLRQADKLVEKAEALQRTDPEAALLVVESALRDCPEHPRGLALRASLTTAVIKAHAAAEAAARAKAEHDADERRRRDERVAASLARVRTLIDKQQLEDAFAELDAISRLDPQVPGLADLRARATAAQAAAEEQRQRLEARRRREQIDGAARRAEAYLAADDLDSAAGVLSAAQGELGSAGELDALQEEIGRRRTARDERDRAVAALVSQLSWAVRLRRFDRARRLSASLLAIDPANASAAELQIDIERLAAQHAKTLDALRRVSRTAPVWAAAVLVLALGPVLWRTIRQDRPPDVVSDVVVAPATPLLPPVTPAAELVPAPPPAPSVTVTVTPAPRPVTPQPAPPPKREVSVAPVPPVTPAVRPAPTPEVRPTPLPMEPAGPRDGAPDRPPVIDDSPRPQLEREPAATPVARPVPPVVQPSARNESAVVASVIRQYQDAYARLDATGVVALWPTMPAAQASQLRQSFAGAREYDLQLSGGNISISGETATASYAGRVAFTPKVGRASAVNVDVTFRLKRAGDNWTIEAVDTRRR